MDDKAMINDEMYMAVRRILPDIPDFKNRAILDAIAPMIAEAEKIRAYKAGELFTLGQVSDFVTKARNKALDEAARVADTSFAAEGPDHPLSGLIVQHHPKRIAAEIRTLKTNVGKENK